MAQNNFTVPSTDHQTYQTPQLQRTGNVAEHYSVTSLDGRNNSEIFGNPPQQVGQLTNIPQLQSVPPHNNGQLLLSVGKMTGNGQDNTAQSTMAAPRKRSRQVATNSGQSSAQSMDGIRRIQVPDMQEDNLIEVAEGWEMVSTPQQKTGGGYQMNPPSLQNLDQDVWDDEKVSKVVAPLMHQIVSMNGAPTSYTSDKYRITLKKMNIMIEERDPAETRYPRYQYRAFSSVSIPKDNAKVSGTFAAKSDSNSNNNNYKKQ